MCLHHSPSPPQSTLTLGHPMSQEHVAALLSLLIQRARWLQNFFFKYDGTNTHAFFLPFFASGACQSHVRPQKQASWCHWLRQYIRQDGRNRTLQPKSRIEEEFSMRRNSLWGGILYEEEFSMRRNSLWGGILNALRDFSSIHLFIYAQCDFLYLLG
jgi:hypothetical protein